MHEEGWGAGERTKWSGHGTVSVSGADYPLIYGENPHSRSDNRHYALMGGEPVGFDGHRILIGLAFESRNYLKTSHLSGSEVRKAGTCRITADGEQVFEFFYRDVPWALLRAHHLIGELTGSPSGWMVKEERDRLVGRPVFYREVPAVVRRLITDQGCLMLETADGQPFPEPVYDGGGPGCDNTVKVEVLSPNIWWFRRASFG